MKINQDFGIALHILSYLSIEQEKYIPSNQLAKSIGANPVIIRNILSKLANENLIITKRGRAGSKLNKKPEDISFYDVYNCLYKETFFKQQHHHNENCPIANNISKSVFKISLELTNEINRALKKYNISNIDTKERE